jgi:perosamine synthetase
VNIEELIANISIPADTTIGDAMRAIDRGALGLALLVDPGTQRFVGLATDGDIRRGLLRGLGLASPVAEVATWKAKTGRLGMGADEVARLFSEPVHVVPLLDEHDRVADLAIFDQRMRLPVAEPLLGERELRYVSEAVLSGWISSRGAFLARFEEMFAAFCGTRVALTTSNGTTALHLALAALDLGPGDEVIVPTLTFIATANAVTYTGARPVFVDSEAATWNLDPAAIEAALTPRTKAIVVVHLYGHPADMGPILSIAQRHSLAVIEDAAEAHGARYRGRRVGGLADIGVFSFYGNKLITTGEGGMVVTDRADLAEAMRIRRDHGMSPNRRYWHPVLGFNYRMTNLQAAVGVAQMERIDEIIARKRSLGAAYGAGLRGIRGLELPPEAEWAESVYWLYTVLVDEQEFGMSRDEVLSRLSEQGIECRPVFPPVHTQPVYETGERFPVAEGIAATGVSLPSAVGLSISDIERVVEALSGLSGAAKQVRTRPATLAP